MHVRFAGPSFKTLIDTTVPKNRKPKFELGLKIHDLNNVPLVNGTSYVKWHLPSSAAAEHRGKTDKAVIKDHKVTWDYEKSLQLRLTIDKNGTLADTDIHFEVLQEYSHGARSDRISLGTLRCNVSEYVEGGEEADGITRRYLMQESKINSTVKISISMKQIDGERNFTAPSLKSAAVFGGIAGIMNSHEAETDELGHVTPKLASQTARDFGELQDMYRRSLAASWSSHMHELPADKCIEDIFAGGDGWGRHSSNALPNGAALNSEHSSGFRTQGRSTPKPNSNGGEGARHRGGKGKLDPNNRTSSSEEMNDSKYTSRDVSEVDLREDLRSWVISAG